MQRKKKWKVYWSYETVTGLEEGTQVVKSTTSKGASRNFRKANSGTVVQGIEEVEE